MEINEFSRQIRSAWDNKYPDANPPADGAILNLAKSSGYDIEFCFDVLAGLSEDAKTSFTTFVLFVKEELKKKKRFSSLEYYHDTKTGNSYLLQRDKQGKQYYDVPVPIDDFQARIWQGFQLNPDYTFDESWTADQRNNWIEKQFDWMFRERKIDEKMYKRAQIGLAFMRGELEYNKHYEVKVTPAELEEVPF